MVSMTAESKHSRQSLRPSLSSTYAVFRGYKIKLRCQFRPQNVLTSTSCMFGDILGEKRIHLHSFTAATSWGSIVFVRRAILLNPKRMCPIFNKTSRICWNLSKKNYIRKEKAKEVKCKIQRKQHKYIWALTMEKG